MKQIKNSITKYALLLTAVLYLVGCSDDFLKTEPTGQISLETLGEMAKKDPESILEPLVLGLYSTTFRWGSGGIMNGPDPSHMDYGQKNVDLCTDLMCGDLASISFSYGWYENIADFTDLSKTGAWPYGIWRYYYRLVKNANEVLDLLGGDEKMPETDALKAYYGQAKAIRAFAYFYLVNLYQHPYSEKKDAPGVPVYRTQVDAEIHGQSSVGEVYDLIVSDLKDAVVALKDFDRGSDKSKINQDVAYGLLANAYLFMGKYQEAADAADAVIVKNSYPILLRTGTGAASVLNNGFNSLANSKNWMWGIDQTTENTGSLINWWAHVDAYTYGYNWAGDRKVIDSILFASIQGTDVRRRWFGAYTTSSPATTYNVNVGVAPLLPIGKFFDPRKNYTNGDKTWDNDLVYMRIEELHLIKAEALARLYDDGGAKAALQVLLDQRNTASVLDVVETNEDLLNVIYSNWRIEMWGEGRSYLAMKRFKATMTRGKNNAVLAGQSFAYNDPRMIFEIPEREWLNNPNLVPQN
jgi:tetratricopeptide (TPR) repeat protein